MFIIPSIELNVDASRWKPAEIADTLRELERTGFARVQVSLGVAEATSPSERLLEDALRDAQATVQLTGRFDSTDEIDVALSAGADVVVLGNRALDELDWLESVASRFPNQLILATPARERRSRSRGAVRTLPLDLRDVAAEVASLPLAGIVVELPADSPIAHPELALLEDVVEIVEFPVMAAGAAFDLARLRDMEFRGVGAAIIGRSMLAAEFDEETLARTFSD